MGIAKMECGHHKINNIPEKKMATAQIEDYYKKKLQDNPNKKKPGSTNAGCSKQYQRTQK